MNNDAKRNLRIQELTRMALAGKKLDEIRIRAYQMAAKKTADGYVYEVLRRIQAIKGKQN